MFRHLLTLIWKRKGRNLMLSLEILLAFIVVFAIAAFGVRSVQMYHLPIGYAIEDVWSVRIHSSADGRSLMTHDTRDLFKRSLRAVPGIAEVAFASTTPYYGHTMVSDFTVPGTERLVMAEIIEMDDEAIGVLRAPLLAGRGFDHSDDGQAVTPVVVNRRAAMALFGTTEVIGKKFFDDERKGPKDDPMLIVGLIEDYRNKGEFSAPRNVVLTRASPVRVGQGGMESMLIKMKPGTTRAFEETLSRQLKLINNEWTYTIAPLSVRRTDAMREQVTPIVILSVVAAFLLLMVAFGLFGVLWQNTTLRIPEIGLRRAIGASAGQIYRQIIAEQLLLSTGAMLIGLLLLAQLPITGAMGEHLNWRAFGVSVALSMTVIYLLSLLCSVYPGWRASRLSPTEALHYE